MKKKAAAATLVLVAMLGAAYLGLKKNIDISGMQTYQTAHFQIYFSSLEDGTKSDVETALETAYPRIAGFFAMEEEARSSIVLYPSVEDFQRAYLGHILSWVYDDWAAGAAYEDMVLAASPENSGAEHTYTDILQILVHEYVHSLIWQINEFPNVWLDEGLAAYLAGQESPLPEILPGFDDFQKDDMGAFLDHDGYAVGYAYIAFLDSAHGNEKILELIRTNDYPAVFGKSAFDMYTEWVRSLESQAAHIHGPHSPLALLPLPTLRVGQP